MIIPMKECRTEANFLDLALMELLDTEVKIDLPRLIIKHMHMVLLKYDKGHALPYAFWLASMFEEYLMPIQVWSLQTMKDVIRTVHHMALLTSVRYVDNPL